MILFSSTRFFFSYHNRSFFSNSPAGRLLSSVTSSTMPDGAKAINSTSQQPQPQYHHHHQHHQLGGGLNLGHALPSRAMTLPRPRQTVSAENVFKAPGREFRPEKICVILRGLPGSGKSHVSRLLRDLEHVGARATLRRVC